MAVALYSIALAFFIISSAFGFYSAYDRPLNLKDLNPSEYTVVGQNIGVQTSASSESNTQSTKGFVYPKFRAPISHLVFGLFIFLLTLVLYYKVVLYIVFGNKK